MIDNFRTAGINLAVEDYDNQGFPNKFVIDLNNISYRNENKTFGWRTDQAIVQPSFSENTGMYITLPTDHFFSYRSSDKEKSTKIGVRTGDNQVIVKIKNNVINTINLKSDYWILQLKEKNNTFSIGPTHCKISTESILLEDRLETAIKIMFSIHDITPPELWKAILEDNFDTLSGNLYFRNPSSLSDFSAFKTFAARGFDTPELVVDNIKLIHRLSKISLNGILTFDHNLMLDGSLVLTISDYHKLLSFLTKKGVLSPEIAKNFRFMLSFLLSTKNLQKTDGTVDINLTVKKNQVYQGEIKLFEL